MSEKVTTEVVRRVFNDDEGVFIEVGPDADGLGIHIHTPSDDSKRWFGNIDFMLTKEMARHLASVLVAAANECGD